MILILVSGGIDFSVGSTVAMCSVCLAQALNAGNAPLAAGAIAILAGACVGCVNGSSVAGCLFGFQISAIFVFLRDGQDLHLHDSDPLLETSHVCGLRGQLCV